MVAAARHPYASVDAAIDDYHARGWTDGLPIVPPTLERVEAALDAAGVDAADVVGDIATRDLVVTAEHVAVNAVMAGCSPAQLPVVLAAVRALLRDEAQCHATTGTLWGASQALVVNGPVRDELGIVAGAGCMGPGHGANAVIGRALRLVVRNACLSVPGGLDRSVFSTPERYSFCFGELDGAEGWVPLHAERGFDAATSAVTVVSVVPSPILVYASPSRADELLDAYLDVLVADRFPWEVDLMGDVADYLLVISPDHAEVLARGGHDKASVRARLWDGLQDAAARLGRRCRIGRPEGILLAVAGGRGGALTWILTPHVGLAVTEPIRTGSPVPKGAPS